MPRGDQLGNAEQITAADIAVGDTIAQTKKAILAGEGIVVGKITPKGARVQLRHADGKMIQSCEPTTKLWRETTKEDDDVSTTTTEPTETAATGPQGFEWPSDPKALLIEYVTDQVSTERNAPNEGRPFVTKGGTLRIRAEHWRGWLTGKGIEAPKMEAGRPIRDAGFAMKPYPLPGEDRSHGFYTGEASALGKDVAKKLPARELERAAGKPRNPFAKLSDEQIGVLKSALANFKGDKDAKAIRDGLVELVEAREV